MTTEFNSQGTATDTEASTNSDGGRTYKATITGLKLTWDGHECDVTADFTVTTPSAMLVPGHGNVFRLGESYDVNVWGEDFPDPVADAGGQGGG